MTCTGSCMSRGCNCRLSDEALRRFQQAFHAEVVVRGIERLLELEGWTRDATGALVSPDGNMRCGP